MRAATSIGKDELNAHSTEAMVKVAIARTRIRRPPNRSVSHPLIGIPIAMVTR
jgi:hypothetical protein